MTDALLRRLSGRGPGGPPAGDRLYTPVILLRLGVVGLSFIGTGFIMPLRSLYARDVGASGAEIGLMVSAFLLANFLATPIIGGFSDRIGHGTVLWLGLLAHGLVALAFIPVQSPEGLIALRALEGITVGAVMPPARALANGLAPRGRQGEVLGAISGAQSGGILFGPALGTVLAEWVGYEPSFLLAGVTLALSALVVWLGLPRRRTAGMAAATAPAVPLAATFSRALWLPYTLKLILSIPNGLFAAVWSLYMIDRGASLPLIGLTFTSFAAPVAFLSPFAGRLADQRGRYWPILAGAIVAGLIYLCYVFPLPPLWIVALSLVEGVGATFAMSALDGLLADVMPRGARGRVQANFSAAATGGSLLGATAAGALYESGPGAPFLAAAVLTLGAAAALLLPAIARRFERRAAVPERGAA